MLFATSQIVRNVSVAVLILAPWLALLALIVVFG
jgi:hypothetical protein